MSLKRPSTRVTCWLDVAAFGEVQSLADELQQAVQLGLALRHQRGRHVELVARQRRQVEIFLAPRLHDELVDEVVAERQAGDLLQERFVVGAEDSHLAADVLDVVLQEEDALRIAAAVGLELVEVQPLQQLAVDPQLEVGHDRAEVGFEVAAGNGRLLLGLEGEAEGPDADLRPRHEDRRLTAQHLLVAHQATVQADVLQLQPAVNAAHDRVMPRDQRALQAHGVGGVAADGDQRLGRLDHRAATLVHLVEPDLQRRDWGLGTGD